MDKHTHSGSKIRNQFTAYIVANIRGVRRNYLRKLHKIHDNEVLMDVVTMKDLDIITEEAIEVGKRENLLLDEARGYFPEWDAMNNQRLVAALFYLCDIEKQLIYQHIFEKRSFEEIGRINGLFTWKVKNIYYYAIRKIRKLMGGDRL